MDKDTTIMDSFKIIFSVFVKLGSNNNKSVSSSLKIMRGFSVFLVRKKEI